MALQKAAAYGVENYTPLEKEKAAGVDAWH